MGQLILAALMACAAALVLTWLTRRLVLALGVLDRPDGVRKLHKAPVPLLGGVGVFGAWVIALCGSGPLWQELARGVGAGPTWGAAATDPVAVVGPGLLLAVGVILLTGILDDLVTLRARSKLIGQILAALLLMGGGLVVERLRLFGHTVELARPLGIALTLVWLVGSMNALNMLDGMDGLASTVGMVTCLTLACMAWLTHHPALSLAVAALAGALAGFLAFNLPPARIFLGDSGSLLIGLVVGVVAIKGSFKTPATVALAAPIAVLAVPIFDGVAAVIRRRLTGSAVYAPDRGHIHHCLQRRGWSTRQILAVVGSLCAVTGLAALAGLYARLEPVAVLATLAVVCGCVATKVFGHFEYRLLLGRPSALWLALRGGLHVKCPVIPLLCWQLRQCRSVEELWTTLVAAAEPLRLRHLEFHLTPPAVPYRAHWEAAAMDPQRPAWHTVLTLTADRRTFGQIAMGGYQHRKSLLADLMNLAAVAETLAAVCRRLHPKDRAVLPLPSGGAQGADPETPRKLSA